MTYKEIAAELTKEFGKEYTEEQVRKICGRALSKLRVSPKVRSYKDFLEDSHEKQ